MTDKLIVDFHDGVCGTRKLFGGLEECQLDDEKVF